MVTEPPLDAYNAYVATHGMMFGFDAQHTRNNPYEQILNVGNVSQLRQKWTAQTGGTEASPTVANGVVYISSYDSKLYAFDAVSGQQKWATTAQPGEHPRASSPAVANGIVYVGSYDSGLYAFDAVSGKQKWMSPVSVPIRSSPIVANGVVYVFQQ